MKLGVRKYKKILKSIKELFNEMGTIQVDWIYELCYMIDYPDSEEVLEALIQGDREQKLIWTIKAPHEHWIDYIDF